MTTDKPMATIEDTPHTETSMVDDGTLVDDTVVLVDSLVSVVGGQSTPIRAMLTSANQEPPQPQIKIRR
jgi:hypothetical protein